MFDHIQAPMRCRSGSMICTVEIDGEFDRSALESASHHVVKPKNADAAAISVNNGKHRDL